MIRLDEIMRGMFGMWRPLSAGLASPDLEVAPDFASNSTVVFPLNSTISNDLA